MECMRTAHDGNLGAHLGQQKMWEYMRKKYYWPGMSGDVKNYKCEFCDVYKAESKESNDYSESIQTLGDIGYRCLSIYTS